MNPELLNQIGPTVLKTIVGLVITGLLGVIMWPLKQAKKEWVDLKSGLAETHAELVTQRENHLTHIEEYGKQQAELLGKTVAALDGVRLDLAELNGYMKGLSRK